MLVVDNKTESLRSLCRVFTRSNLREALVLKENSTAFRRLKLHVGNSHSQNLGTVLRGVYRQLEKSYPNEYLYKNAILNQTILAKYSLTSTVVFDEFRISSSVADLVLLNGETRVFEVKTDLDSLEKLDKQIHDYQKFAEKVYVVTSEKHSKPVLDRFPGSPIGVLVYGSQGRLEMLREATAFYDNLDHEAIFKTLRKTEYMELITAHFGEQPEYPNTQVFRKCLELVKSIDIREFQASAVGSLKGRNGRFAKLTRSRMIPRELKYLFYISDLNLSEFESLRDLLSTKL